MLRNLKSVLERICLLVLRDTTTVCEENVADPIVSDHLDNLLGPLHTIAALVQNPIDTIRALVNNAHVNGSICLLRGRANQKTYSNANAISENSLVVASLGA